MAPTDTPAEGSSFPILDPPERESWLGWLRSTLVGLGPARLIGAALSFAAMATLIGLLWSQPSAAGQVGLPPAPTSSATPSPTLFALTDPSTASFPTAAAAGTAPAGLSTPTTTRPTAKATAKPTPKPTAKPTAKPSPSATPSGTPTPPPPSPTSCFPFTCPPTP
ncbi:MAG: hypothetical protein M3Z57_09695 [Candidatus Dormibacteraeota bacterium]|nr:hypothetical protein [Candidatus Dormibacteraeota bacterium]